jgi:hypothetical protein
MVRTHKDPLGAFTATSSFCVVAVPEAAVAIATIENTSGQRMCE